MLRSIHKHAFQLEIGDKILLGGRYLQVSDIQGSYERGRGVVVDILTQAGWSRISVYSLVEVFC